MPDPAGGVQRFTGRLAERRRGQQFLPRMICAREGGERRTRSRFGIGIWNQQKDNEAFTTFTPLLTKQREEPVNSISPFGFGIRLHTARLFSGVGSTARPGYQAREAP